MLWSTQIELSLAVSAISSSLYFFSFIFHNIFTLLNVFSSSFAPFRANLYQFMTNTFRYPPWPSISCDPESHGWRAKTKWGFHICPQLTGLKPEIGSQMWRSRSPHTHTVHGPVVQYAAVLLCALITISPSSSLLAASGEQLALSALVLYITSRLI